MITVFILVIILIVLLALLFVIKKSSNEIIEGLGSISKQLKFFQDEFDKRQ